MSKEEVRCWICGRTGDEVRASLDFKTDREAEIEGMTARVEDSRRRFATDSKTWAETVPEKFGGVGFAFVLNNPKQFRAVQFLEDITRAKKSLVDSLVDAARLLHEGKDAALGIVSVRSSDRRLTELLALRLAEFERKSGRSLVGSREGSLASGTSKGFEGLSLRDGLRFLTEVGLLYYAIQAELLQVQKEEARGMRPEYRVSLVVVKGRQSKVPLCNVCEQLVR